MSFTHNKLFLDDPLAYLKKLPVNQNDLESYVYGEIKAAAEKKRAAGPFIKSLNDTKEINLDLVAAKERNVLFRLYCRRLDATLIGDGLILAHWIPYNYGSVKSVDDIYFCDVKKASPEYPFAFTPGMNGCSLVVTEHPTDESKLRCYHYQNCDSNPIFLPPKWNKKGTGFPATRIYGWLAFDDYAGSPDGKDPFDTSAFNFLLHDGADWHFVSQPLRRKKDDPQSKEKSDIVLMELSPRKVAFTRKIDLAEWRDWEFARNETYRIEKRLAEDAFKARSYNFWGR